MPDNELIELRAENSRLRAAVLNQAGDNLCWLTDPDKTMVPPVSEFLESCSRFHAQMASTNGVLGPECMTIAQLEAEVLRQTLNADINEQCARIYVRKQPFCEHANRYAFTDDGGKTGRCVMCQNERLEALLNTPETEDFDKAVPLEAAHQVQRWGSEHDAGKEPADWFWLIGYLAGKALASAIAGNVDQAKHHCISSAAALRNWHAQLRSGESVMRPGIGEEKREGV